MKAIARVNGYDICGAGSEQWSSLLIFKNSWKKAQKIHKKANSNHFCRIKEQARKVR